MIFEKILVPVDGSVRSDIATEIAINSAKDFGTHIMFLNVVDFSSNMKFGRVEGIDEILELQTEGQKAIDRVIAMSKEAGIPYDTKIVQGDPADVIIKMSKNYDQIVLGVTGKGGVGRIGHTAEKVIEKSACPVLTVKSGSRGIHYILLPVSNMNTKAIEVAIENTKAVNGELTILAIKNDGVDAEALVKEISDKCKDAEVRAETKIREGDPVEVILAQSGKYDLVIMGTMSLGKGDVLHGGVTEHLILHSSCPVTVVRDQ